MARLSGHTGLKLSIRRLALYTRQRLLAVSSIVVAIGEVANFRVRLSNYLVADLANIDLANLGLDDGLPTKRKMLNRPAAVLLQR